MLKTMVQARNAALVGTFCDHTYGYVGEILGSIEGLRSYNDKFPFDVEHIVKTVTHGTKLEHSVEQELINTIREVIPMAQKRRAMALYEAEVKNSSICAIFENLRICFTFVNFQCDSLLLCSERRML